MNPLSLGYMQGRLSDFRDNGIVDLCLPSYWDDEFFAAKNLKLDFLELITEKTLNSNNPLWSNDGIQKLKTIAERTQVFPRYICHNEIMTTGFLGEPALQRIAWLSKQARELGVYSVILPLFDCSQISQKGSSFDLQKDALRRIKDILHCDGINMLVETDLDAVETCVFLNSLDGLDLGLVFDTGNSATLAVNIEDAFAKYGSRIKHIHLKDKNMRGTNVKLGTGVVNFNQICRALRRYSYEGDFCFETLKGDKALSMAEYNVNFFKKFSKKLGDIRVET